MTNIETVLDYHEQTKHFYRRYAKSIGYLDWANKPYPYREYNNTQKLPLKLSFENKTPAYSSLFSKNIEAEEINYENISQFFQFSMGLAAKKSTGTDEWELRCNASSGNLHPTESYIITNSEDHLSAQAGVFHYNPYKHELERTADIDQNLNADSFIIGISSILYREIWKYGERAFRYTQLDAGHALRSFEVSALLLGWKVKVIDIKFEEAQALFGFGKTSRYIEQESENIDMVLQISKTNNSILDVKTYQAKTFLGSANILTSNHQSWPLITQVEEASSQEQRISAFSPFKPHNSSSTKESKEVILNRRSAQMMDQHRSTITYEQFIEILRSISAQDSKVHLAIFVNSVEGLESGLYLYLRDEKQLSALRTQMKSTFTFQAIEENLYLLEKGAYRQNAKNISCTQDIASDGAFSLGMLCEFEENIKTHGALEYKKLYWECGSIGQQLYLEATALGLSATGIGCFLDDAMHSTLGIKNRNYQVLYHFTIGRAIVDLRLQSLHPYSHLID